MDTTSLPTGTVTFLFTDIEGSTQLWEQHPDAMRLALARHDACLNAAIESNRGLVFKTVGDAFCAAFATAADAIDAALAAQCNLRALQPSAVASAAALSLRVRIALHTGAAEARGVDYFGPALNRIARLLAIAHGGQVLLSGATQELVQDDLPPGASLRDLGLHRLRDLQRPEQVYQLLAPDLPADFPPLRSLAAFRHNLPVQLTSFIGREREMAEVKRLLAATRLLTLTGSGGCGKTRLALQVAADLLEECADGVCLVELAALVDPALVPQAVSSALGLREEPGRPLTAMLTDYLRSRSLLLVLDNCEHLLSACAQLVESLLRACRHLRVLASSREGLGVGGEQTYPVPSLSLPDPQHLPSLKQLQEFEAVQLFAERAGLSQPSFAVTAANAPAVVQVCRRLDGIPLAIELAAARVKSLPVEQIAARLDDRFRLLTGGSRTALPRQQTLRGLIDWSYNLLPEPERALLRRLSVFAGGWTLEAAEAICSGDGMEAWEVLDLSTQLVEKSLVQYEAGEGEGRYRLLETVRQYARDRLLESGEGEAVRGRHRDWFLEVAVQAEPELDGSHEREWLDRLEREHDNLRAALAWSGAEGQGEAGLRLGGALGRFWAERGYLGEGREHLAELLARPGAGARTASRAKALNKAGILAVWQGNCGAARDLHEEGLAIWRELGDRQGIALSLIDLGVVAQYQGDYVAARRLFEDALAINRALGNRRLQAPNLYWLGMIAMAEGDYARAKTSFEEALAIDREFGLRGGGALWALGRVALRQGNCAAARQLFEEDLQAKRELKLKPSIAFPLESLGDVAYLQEDYGTAQALFKESLTIVWDWAINGAVAHSLERLAAVAGAQGQAERGARLFGAAEALREMIGAPLPPSERADYDRHVAAARAALGEEAFAAAWAAGRAMALDEAVALALDETDAG